MKELPIWLNRNRNLKHLSWYIDELKLKNLDFFNFIENKINVNVLDDSEKINNSEICFNEFGKLNNNNYELLNFLYFSILPILPINNPLKKLFDNPKITSFISKNNIKNKNYNKFSIIENLLDSSAKTYYIYSANNDFKNDINFKNLNKSKNPDILIIEGNKLPENISALKQQILITENFYSWEKIAPHGKINLNMIEKLIEDPSKIISTITEISLLIKKTNVSYILRRIPLTYNAIIENIIEKIGFPPSSSFNLKSELLTDSYLVIWNL